MDHTQAIERLRTAGKAEDTRHEKTGVTEGATWAEQTATPLQLQRLAASDWKAEGRPDAPYRHCDLLYLVIEPMAKTRCDDDAGAIQREADEFWQVALGEGLQELIDVPAFLDGFVVGACGFWSQVEDKV